MAACVCGRTYRKGSMAFVIVNRKIQARRVCSECAAQAVPILAPKVEARTVKKEVRSDVVQRCIRMLTVYARAARNENNPELPQYRPQYAQGREEAFLGAIELLKRESGEA